jgi:hypothetical protein
MGKFRLISVFLFLAPIAAGAGEQGRVYKWVDADGELHYSDSIPAKYAEMDKQVLNDHGVTIDRLRGKRTPEEIEAERVAAEMALQEKLARRADMALLATYLTVDEILMHRDRRVELFQAQSRVTELYLHNLDRRLTNLRREASRFRPYTDNPDAPMIAPDLVTDIGQTQDTITRHQRNLEKFQADEQQIIARFQGDINRFKALKGIE